MIHFESDYLEGCCPQILDALRETNLEQTLGYGEDPHCATAADRIRFVFDCPDAEVHFLVGGTQANATVISSLLRPHQGVLCAASGHINVHETGAVEHGGHKILALPATDGKISAAQVRDALEAHQRDFSREHMVQPGMVYISFPTELGTIYTRQELEALHAVCAEWEIPLFIDGARLGYGLEASGCMLLPRDIPASQTSSTSAAPSRGPSSAKPSSSPTPAWRTISATASSRTAACWPRDACSASSSKS